MKYRVRIDVSILFFVIIFTGVLYRMPQLYIGGVNANHLLDFLGVIVILLGTYLRMSARGYKKENSDKGKSLVVEGPYTLVRNPMYLGTLLIGSGFVLIIWPWWSLPVFVGIFYARFRRQIIKEETYLKELFTKTFEDYCSRVPRLFPTIKTLRKAQWGEIFISQSAWTTKEKWGLIGWPVLAVFFEVLQNNIVFGFRDTQRTIFIFVLGIIVFAIMAYKLNQLKSK